MKTAKEMRLHDWHRTSANKNNNCDYYTTRAARRQGVRPIPAVLGFALLFGAVSLADCGLLSLRVLAALVLFGAALMFGGVRNA